MSEPTYIGHVVPPAREMLLDFLDAARREVVATVSDLDAADQQRSLLPSGWTPLELLAHLAFMERRWLVWAFLGEDVPEPHADRGGDLVGPFTLPRGWGLDETAGVLEAQGERTRRIVEANDLETLANVGGRFAEGDDTPSLGWILFHVLGEYSRHAGQLDVAVELLTAAHDRYGEQVPDADSEG